MFTDYHKVSGSHNIVAWAPARFLKRVGKKGAGTAIFFLTLLTLFLSLPTLDLAFWVGKNAFVAHPNH